MHNFALVTQGTQTCFDADTIQIVGLTVYALLLGKIQLQVYSKYVITMKQ